jgi:ribosomal-protein-alanine N-acetyltransferase
MIGGFFNRRPDYDVVPMQPAHSVQAAEIHAAGFSRAWSIDEIETLLDQTNVDGFVAFASGEKTQVAGFVLTRFAADEAEVLTIAVRRRHRRRGVGWRLMLAAIRQMRDAGAERLFLEVDETNASAVALYKRLGFVKVAERRAYYKHEDGGRSAALVMRLDLI